MPLHVRSDLAQAFLRSARVLQTKQASLETTIEWLAELNHNTAYQINTIAFDQLRKWHFDDGSGSIRHESGRFFSIEGYRIDTNFGGQRSWDQPLINQNEVGYLGFIVQNFNGVLHFLTQAKIEPGNSNIIQLSPTLQATRSNYSQVHQGKKPRYLEYFQQAKHPNILVDQLQSEQGSRFLGKRNRNIIIRVDQTIDLQPNFRWLTLGQLKALMNHENLVNMDTRTVIAGIHFGDTSCHLDLLRQPQPNHLSIHQAILNSALDTATSLHSFEEISSKLTHLKSLYDLHRKRIPLDSMHQWKVSSYEITHAENQHFKVIAVDVKIEGREVHEWTQPMVAPVAPGVCAFIAKIIDHKLYLAVQLKFECGNHDAFEFAPTVQCLDGYHADGTPVDPNPFFDYVLHARREQFLFDAVQAEEGGRFYRDDNRNCLVLADHAFAEQLPENFIWLNLNQIYSLMRFSNLFNIQARSLIAAIPFHPDYARPH